MVVDNDERQTAAVHSDASEVSELKSQIQELTAQVAALKVAQKNRNPPQCYYCKQPGHTQRYCPSRVRERRCYICGRPGHIAAVGNERGMSLGGNRHPYPTHTVVVATTKLQTAVIMGNIGHSTLEVILDSGSSISYLAQFSIPQMTNIIEKPIPRILLKTASGVPLPTVKYITASVLIQNMKTPVQHNFLWLVISLLLQS